MGLENWCGWGTGAGEGDGMRSELRSGVRFQMALGLGLEMDMGLRTWLRLFAVRVCVWGGGLGTGLE